jgi:sensor histidine kinase regulating citrate/malate metabolism
MDVMITASVLLLLAFNIFLAWFQTSIQEKNKKFSEIQILLQKEQDNIKYYDALQKQDEKQKILIHDIKRHLATIYELNKNEERQKIFSYIEQIVHSSNLQESVHVCDNNLLNTIIFRARQKCKENAIALRTDIRSGCIALLSDYDITSLFSNLLDNAVEAASDVPEAFIELNVTPRESHSLLITMINSCKKNPFTDDSQLLFSTKKDKQKHGYGMKSIQRVVTKNHGDSHLYYNEKNRTFHTIIVLKPDGITNNEKLQELLKI